ncbi:MAG: translation initiation factor IF-2 N-terminal domain-containing protein, partial [Clostridia bacterium]|nr:translation initiation factor IF-2 N-terminal domain-containing protein [Clostridia bacterium]
MATLKLQEIAKELTANGKKVTGKELIEKLSNYGVAVKSGSAMVEEEELGLILEIYTQAFDMGDEPIVKPEGAVKKEEKKEEPKPEEQPKEEKKAEPEKEAQAEKKEEKKAPEKKEDKKAKKNVKYEKTPSNKPKQEKIELKFVSDEKEQIKVSDDNQKVRYVDTRTSTVEIEKIESRERLEHMVSD